MRCSIVKKMKSALSLSEKWVQLRVWVSHILKGSKILAGFLGPIISRRLHLRGYAESGETGALTGVLNGGEGVGRDQGRVGEVLENYWVM